MKKEMKRKNSILIILLIVLSVALVASGVTLAINIFSHEDEQVLDFGVISLDTSLNTAFNSGNLDSVINGQKLADKIKITNSTISNVAYYLRVQFIYTTDNNELLPRNQLQYLSILNNTFEPFDSPMDYSWSMRNGDYFYLTYNGSDTPYRITNNGGVNEFTFIDELTFESGVESYPANYSKPTGLKLIINVQVIQADYILDETINSYSQITNLFQDIFPTEYTTDVTFDIYFDANGGTGVSHYIEPVPYGTPINLPTTPGYVKANYSLQKWNDGVKLYNPGSSYIVTGNVTFKVMWRITETDASFFTFTSIESGAAYEVSKKSGVTLPGFTVIPTTYSSKPVKKIKDGGFAGATEIVTLYIPISVEAEEKKSGQSSTGLVTNQILTIGNYAFDGCSSISDITFEADTQTIGNAAFRNCTNLRSIKLPQSVTNLGYRCFENCSVMKTADLSPAMTLIRKATFKGCSSLKEIIFPRLLTAIHTEAFYGCSTLKTITLPLKLKSVGPYAFASDASNPMKLEEIILEYGLVFDASYQETDDENSAVKTNTNGIGPYAFTYCQKLVKFEVPEEITKLSDGVFQYCTSLEDVKVGSNLYNIGAYCFSYCSSLEVFEFPVPPAGVTYVIGASAFEYCVSIASMVLPASLKALSNGVFRGCTNLKRVTATGTLTIGDYSFADCPNFAGYNSQRTMFLPRITKIGSHAFYNGKSITEVYLGTTLTEIGSYAFAGCSALTDMGSASTAGSVQDTYGVIYLYKHTSITKIGAYAFSDCTSIVSASIPTSVGSDDTYAGNSYNSNSNMLTYAGSSGKTYSQVYDTTEAVGKRNGYKLGEGIFYNCINLTYFNAVTSNPSSLTTYPKSCYWSMSTKFIREYMFYNCNFYSIDMDGEPSVIFGISCFENCSKVSMLNFNTMSNETTSYIFDVACLNNFGTEPVYPNNVFSTGDDYGRIGASYRAINTTKRMNVRFNAGRLVIRANRQFSRNLFTALGNRSGDYITINAYFDWDDPSAWNNSVDTAFGGGEGTKDNPFQISTPAQLAFLRNQANSISSSTTGKYYVITCSLNMNSYSFGGIGSYSGKYYGTASASYAFKGTLTMGYVPSVKVRYNTDGTKSFSDIRITNLSVSNSSSGAATSYDAYAGLFNFLPTTATVQGLSIYNGTIMSYVSASLNTSVTKGGSYAGAVAGINNGIIRDCHVGVNRGVSASYRADETQTSGVYTYTNDYSRYQDYKNYVLTITYSNGGSVTIGSDSTYTTDAHNGGVVGQQHNSNALIQACFVGSSVYVYGASKRWSSVGGIIGSNNNAVVRNCISVAYVYARASSSTSAYLFSFAGGIAGVNAGIIYACYAAAYVYGYTYNSSYTARDKSYSGGIVGYMHNQYAKGTTATYYSFYMNGSSRFRIDYGGLLNRVGIVNCYMYATTSSVTYSTSYSPGVRGNFTGRIQCDGVDYVIIFGIEANYVVSKDTEWPSNYPGTPYGSTRTNSLSVNKGITGSSGDYGEAYSSMYNGCVGLSGRGAYIYSGGSVPYLYAFNNETVKSMNSTECLIVTVFVIILACDIVLVSIAIGNRRRKNVI